MKKIIVIAALITVFLSPGTCTADTLLVSAGQPDLERLLLFGGKYYLKLKLTESNEAKGQKTLNIDCGVYQVVDKEIFFEYPVPKAGDTIMNEYFNWLPGKSAPDFNTDFEVMVKKVFGSAAMLDGMVNTYHPEEYKGLFSDGVLSVGRGKKYRVEKI